MVALTHTVQLVSPVNDSNVSTRVHQLAIITPNCTQSMIPLHVNDHNVAKRSTEKIKTLYDK